MTKILVAYIIYAFLIVMTLMAILNVCYSLVIFKSVNGDILYMPYQFMWIIFMYLNPQKFNKFIRRLPWNQRTLIGWIGLNVLSCFAAGFYLFINYAFLAFFVGICENHLAFHTYFKESIEKLHLQPKSSHKSQFIELIKFHSMTRW